MAPPSAPPVAVTAIDSMEADTAPVTLEKILVALDNSDHGNRALAEAMRLAKTVEGVITGIHTFAAKLHDRRFRQMEGGLPERYRAEEEMGRQREVHDDLITRGLGIISDSYHDVGQRACDKAGLAYRRLSPEGKNYRRIVEAAEQGDYGLLALGALGLGAVPASVVGTVCERVARRSPIDTLVIRDPEKSIGEGPIVVGVDGSDKSFGALIAGLEIGRRLGVKVHAIAAYDPYYHYVAFNKIAQVLSDEAGKVFRFKEQEALHEELIDDGLAKIYQSHLDIAKRTAELRGDELICSLLDGKAYHAILGYLKKVDASLLMVGKTGVHADPELDIGGNAENLLRMAPCHIWLGQRTFTPELDVIAEETIVWSEEAEAYLNRAPEFARGMARKAVLRKAHESGHTFVTLDIVREVAQRLMPARCKAHSIKYDQETDREVSWNGEASALIDSISDRTLAANIRLRAEKLVRREGAETVSIAHVRRFLNDSAAPSLNWTAEALARLARVPAPMQERTRARIEAAARDQGKSEVTVDIVELGMVEARKAMHATMLEGGHKQLSDEEG